MAEAAWTIATHQASDGYVWSYRRYLPPAGATPRGHVVVEPNDPVVGDRMLRADASGLKVRCLSGNQQSIVTVASVVSFPVNVK